MFRGSDGRSSLLLLLVLVAVVVAIGGLVVGFLAVRSLSQPPEATPTAPTAVLSDLTSQSTATGSPDTPSPAPTALPATPVVANTPLPTPRGSSPTGVSTGCSSPSAPERIPG